MSDIIDATKMGYDIIMHPKQELISLVSQLSSLISEQYDRLYNYTVSNNYKQAQAKNSVLMNDLWREISVIYTTFEKLKGIITRLNTRGGGLFSSILTKSASTAKALMSPIDLLVSQLKKVIDTEKLKFNSLMSMINQYTLDVLAGKTDVSIQLDAIRNKTAEFISTYTIINGIISGFNKLSTKQMGGNKYDDLVKQAKNIKMIVTKHLKQLDKIDSMSDNDLAVLKANSGDIDLALIDLDDLIKNIQLTGGRRTKRKHTNKQKRRRRTINHRR